MSRFATHTSSCSPPYRASASVRAASARPFSVLQVQKNAGGAQQAARNPYRHRFLSPHTRFRLPRLVIRRTIDRPDDAYRPGDAYRSEHAYRPDDVRRSGRAHLQADDPSIGPHPLDGPTPTVRNTPTGGQAHCDDAIQQIDGTYGDGSTSEKRHGPSGHSSKHPLVSDKKPAGSQHESRRYLAKARQASCTIPARSRHVLNAPQAVFPLACRLRRPKPTGRRAGHREKRGRVPACVRRFRMSGRELVRRNQSGRFNCENTHARASAPPAGIRPIREADPSGGQG